MPRKKSNKIRIDFRKGHQAQPRRADLTSDYQQAQEDIDTVGSQRVSGKGDLTRRRTVRGVQLDAAESDTLGNVELETSVRSLTGTVIRVHGLESIVQLDDGRIMRCAVRRLLKNMATAQRHVVVTGDRVVVEPHGVEQGWIVRVEGRRSELSRASRNRRHVIVANVDQLLFVTSAAQPGIKPNLIDRVLLTAEQNHLDAVVCINKCDLIDPSGLQSLIGTYAQMGYTIVMVSATQGWGIQALQRIARDRVSVVVGQSGVGKSSILNAIAPGLNQRVQAVSADNQKGKHTTTTSEWFDLPDGGAIVDTPGVRQFQLWDIASEELTGLFRDIRPFASRCRYPNCSHQHENLCAVKDAVADGRLDARRYDSYSQILDNPALGGSDDFEESLPQSMSDATYDSQPDGDEVDDFESDEIEHDVSEPSDLQTRASDRTDSQVVAEDHAGHDDAVAGNDEAQEHQPPALEA
jgi:ribosome biogenesis GTPase / thiamine phosphate phosphatase